MKNQKEEKIKKRIYIKKKKKLTISNKMYSTIRNIDIRHRTRLVILCLKKKQSIM